MMRRRGGLVRAAATTAVVAGTAGAVSHHQQQKYAQQAEAQAYEQQQAAPPPQQYAPAPAAAPEDPQIAQLQKLADLHTAGILSDEEFAAAKAKALGICSPPLHPDPRRGSGLAAAGPARAASCEPRARQPLGMIGSGCGPGRIGSDTKGAVSVSIAISGAGGRSPSTWR